MEYLVTAVNAAERRTAVIAATTTWQEFPVVWRRLLDEVHADVWWDGTGRHGRNVMFYKDDVPRVEIGVELDQPVHTVGRVVRSVLPAGPAAMTTHCGPYEELGSAHDAVRAWCTEQGLRLLGPRWEIYGHWNDNPARRKTQVYYLLSR